MRVLFYLYPGILSQGPLFTSGHATLLASLMGGLLSVGGADCRMILGRQFEEHVRPMLPAGSFATIDGVELHRAIARCSPGLATLTTVCASVQSNAPGAAIDLLIDRIRAASPEFTPDVVVTFSMQADYLRRLWPDALILHAEASAFSKSPFPFSLYFDHHGTYHRSALAKLDPDALEVDVESRLLGQELCAAAKSALTAGDPFRDLPIPKFDAYALLPLAVSNFFSFDESSPCRTQFEFLVELLTHAPPEVGVIVTEYFHWGAVVHDDGPAMNRAWLESNFRNFVFRDATRRFATPSPYLLPKVDGVVTVSSNLGPQAFLFGKRLGVNPTSPLGAVAHDRDWSSFFRNVAFGAAPADRSAWLAWYLSRYAVPIGVCSDGRLFADYLVRRLESRDHSSLSEQFPPIGDFDALRHAWGGWPAAPVLM